MCILKSTKYNNGDTRHGHFMECLISDCFQGSNYYLNQCRRVLMPILLYLESFFCMYVVQSNRQGCFTDTEVISQLFRYVTKAKIERNLYNSMSMSQFLCGCSFTGFWVKNYIKHGRIYAFHQMNPIVQVTGWTVLRFVSVRMTT